MINYYGRFVKNFRAVIYPINRLLKSNTTFDWSRECDKAFKAIKEQFQSNDFLAHYDSKFSLVLTTDASPYEVSAVLSHVYPNGSERAIQYASQSLSETQKKYSQIDKEASSIDMGVLGQMTSRG